MKFSRNHLIFVLVLVVLVLLFRPRTSGFDWKHPFKKVKVCRGVCDRCVLDLDNTLQCSGSKPHKRWCLGPQGEPGRHSMCCPCK